MENKIEEWSSSLTYRLIEIRLVDMSEMKQAIKTHIKSALYDCLRAQIPQTEKEKDKLKELLHSETDKKNKHSIMVELANLNKKLKTENKALNKLEHENRERELILWMREHHNDSLEKFYKIHDEKFPKL
jgi:hypothetical protein